MILSRFDFVIGELYYYRVVAIGNQKYRLSDACTSLVSYCTPDVIFYLSTQGLEEPGAEFLGLRPQEPPRFGFVWVEFEYDGGCYYGLVDLQPIHWHGHIVELTIENISSL